MFNQKESQQVKKKKEEEEEEYEKKKKKKEWANPILIVQNYFYYNITSFICNCYYWNIGNIIFEYEFKTFIISIHLELGGKKCSNEKLVSGKKEGHYTSAFLYSDKNMSNES